MQKALLSPGGYLSVRPLAGHVRDAIGIFGSAVFPGYYHVYFPNGPLPKMNEARVTPDIAAAWTRVLPGKDLKDDRASVMSIRVFRSVDDFLHIDPNSDDFPTFEYFWFRQLLGRWQSPRVGLDAAGFSIFETELPVPCRDSQ